MTHATVSNIASGKTILNKTKETVKAMANKTKMLLNSAGHTFSPERSVPFDAFKIMMTKSGAPSILNRSCNYV